jgi:hypothetical protein
MPSPYSDLLYTIALPAAASLLAGGALWALRRRQPQGTPYALGLEGAVLAAGLGAGVIIVRGWNGLPPTDLNDWPGILAILAAGLALAATTGLRWLAPLALIVVAIASPLLLKIPLRGWSLGEAALWLPAAGVGWLLLILATRATAARLPDAALPAWGSALAVSAAIAAIAGSSSTAQHLGGAAAAAGVWSVLRLVCGDSIRSVSVGVACAAIAPMWWLIVQTGTDAVPPLALLPLAAAPLAAWAAWPLRHRPWPAAILSAILAGGLAALALLLVQAPPPPSW